MNRGREDKKARTLQFGKEKAGGGKKAGMGQKAGARRRCGLHGRKHYLASPRILE